MALFEQLAPDAEVAFPVAMGLAQTQVEHYSRNCQEAVAAIACGTWNLYHRINELHYERFSHQLAGDRVSGYGPRSIVVELVDIEGTLSIKISRSDTNSPSIFNLSMPLCEKWIPPYCMGMDPVLEWQCLNAYHINVHAALYAHIKQVLVSWIDVRDITVGTWLQHPRTAGEAGHLLLQQGSAVIAPQ